MAKTPPDEDTLADWPGVVVTVTGTGLTPGDLPARELIELLQATLASLEAVAQEKGLRLPKDGFRLTGIRKGSVALDLRSPDPTLVPVVSSFVEAARTRGKNNGPRVRHQLERLQKASRTGSIRLVYKNESPVEVAPPLKEVLPGWEETHEVYGEVVGLHKVKGVVRLTLRYEEGGTEDFLAHNDAARLAVRFFGRKVRCLAAFAYSDDEEESGLEILKIDPWEGDVQGVEFFDEVRTELASEGIKINAGDWLLTEDD